MLDNQPLILIVDDEEQALFSLEVLLRIAGFNNVEKYHDSREVPALLKRRQYAVALIDLSMPYVSGFDLLEAFRETSPAVPVIVVTASDDIATAVSCLKSGAFDYLVKPINKELLLPTVSRAVELSMLRRENRYLKKFLIAGDGSEISLPTDGYGGNSGYHMLVAARNEFRSLAQRVPVPIFVTTAESGDVEFCNDAYARFFGFTRAGDAVAGDTRLLDCLPAGDATDITNRLGSGESIEGLVLQGVGPGIRQFTIMMSCVAQDGYCTGSFIDITEHRALEKQFLQAQKMDAVGRFASAIAHDFNNVLTAIAGSADLVLLDPSLCDTVAAHTREIKSATKIATSLTAQLLSFGRGDDFESSRVSAHELMEETRSLLLRLLDPRVRMEFQLNAVDDTIEIAHGRLQQILVNLVINARDAIDGEGTITVQTTTAERISDDGSRQSRLGAGTYLCLTVADNGGGMTDETKTRVFEPFFTTKETGTGLGLSTVFRIIEQSGGSVDIQSRIGEGTAVTVLLPTAAVQAQA